MERRSGGLLSEREQAVLELVVHHFTNDEIGQKLGISEVTVKKHVSRLLLKLGAANRLDLSLKAIARGLVRSPEALGADDLEGDPPATA